MSKRISNKNDKNRTEFNSVYVQESEGSPILQPQSEELEKLGQLNTLNPEKGFPMDLETRKENLSPEGIFSSNSETRRESLSSKELVGQLKVSNPEEGFLTEIETRKENLSQEEKFVQIQRLEERLCLHRN